MEHATSVLVTGATGFVGSNVVRAARDAGLEVITHARRPTAGIDCSADLSDPVATRSLPLANISALIHCAAAIPSRSEAFVRDNARVAIVLANALLNATSLRRIIHVSSVAVYRKSIQREWWISEDAAVLEEPDEPVESYGHSKRRVELSLNDVRKHRPEISICHLRASSIYGPEMRATTLLPVLVSCARQNKPMVLRGSPAYRQNFVHVRDVAAIALTMMRDVSEPSESVINTFSDDTYGLFDLSEMIRAQLNSSSEIIDNTEDGIQLPVPTFDNARVKRRHARFLRLHENLLDLPP